MHELIAHLALGLDTGRPVDDEGIADATSVRLALPPAKRRVAGPRPTPGVVIEVLGAAQIIESGQVLLQGFGDLVEDLGSGNTPPYFQMADLSFLQLPEHLVAAPASQELSPQLD